MRHLSLSFLGGFQVMLDGQPVTAFGTDKVRALLAYLAVEAGRAHRRTGLAGMFWPELSDERAAANLRQSLLRLRQALGEDAAPQPFLSLNGQDVQFNSLSSHRLDVADFQELLRAADQHRHGPDEACSACIGWLRQAADLYRGDLLAGFAPRDCLPFEEWQLVQQEALHGKALAALAQLATYYERSGEPALVLEYARRLVALEPWQEQAQMQVMAALVQCGQDAAALEQYANYSRMLAREFGIEPSPEATALHQQIQARHAGSQIAARPGAGRKSHSQNEVSAMSPPVQDERRQVTVLVYRWQAPPNIADPEELQEQMVRHDALCAAAIERYGGARQPRQGAERLVYFGYPVAQEDAGRRAVYTALAMVAATGGAATGGAATGGTDQVSIGIHSGIMISSAGELVGNVPDLARDCMQLAEDNRVMVTADTERLVRGWFNCEPVAVSGSPRQTLIYEVQGERSRPNYAERQDQARQLTRFTGREAELQQLLACLDRVQAGQGRVITVCGEPGIGKTRLAREFKQICSWPATWLESQCLPYFQNTSLYPIVRLLEDLLGFAPGDGPEARRDKLSAALARYELAHPATIWLLSLLLGLPTDAPGPQTITEDIRERMRETFVALLQAEAARQPLMIKIEDLHWSDPTTVTWLGRSLDALAAAPCVLWLTWRPGFVAPWPPRPHVLSLELCALAPADAERMVSDVAGHGRLPDELRQHIVRQTDGIPLFVEELTKSLLEAPDSDMPQPGQGGVTAAVPVTLRDSLTARLDRTGRAKETAGWAAALGRDFSYPVLAAVVPFSEQRLGEDLAALREAGLLVTTDDASGAAPHTSYAFKHALIQEAAYGLLARRSRQEHHRRIAETLLARFPGVADRQPEILAQHYAQAGLAAQGADYWTRAGERAAALGAVLEARAFFDRALAAIEPGDHARRWTALLGREAALNLLGEREAQAADTKALLQLAEALDDDTRRVEVYLRQSQYASRIEDFQLKLRASTAACAAAARTRDLALELKALAQKVTALARLWQPDAAGKVLEETLARLPALQDPIVKGYVLGEASGYYADRGDSSRSLVLQLQSAEVMRRAGDRYRVGRLLANIGLHYAQLGLYAEAQAALEEGLAIAEAIGDRNAHVMHQWNLSYVYWSRGERDRAGAVGENALRELRTDGRRPLAMATCLGYLGLIYEDRGDPATAAANLAEARALYAGAAPGWIGPLMEAQAVEARCRLAAGQRDEARRLAIEVRDHLRHHGTLMIDFPSRVYVCIAEVAAAVETPGITRHEAIQAGYAELMRRAEMIEDPVWRRSFLENELSNRKLLAAWEREQHNH
jgi:DNA-binding SARP family transcriptional activator/tetratricopeptide (TPR) repeat protein